MTAGCSTSQRNAISRKSGVTRNWCTESEVSHKFLETICITVVCLLFSSQITTVLHTDEFCHASTLVKAKLSL
jgi:hypothetical protein